MEIFRVGVSHQVDSTSLANEKPINNSLQVENSELQSNMDN